MQKQSYCQIYPLKVNIFIIYSAVKRQREILISGSLLKYLQQWRLGQARTVSLESNQGLPRGQQGSKTPSAV